jgi:hypothetical protein
LTSIAKPMSKLAPQKFPVQLALVLSVSAALLIPALFMDGMFMDGLLYTCVGKNLASGIGTFWDPQFSSTYMQSYHEQPPLLFGLMAVFFKILGNSLYTERVYCLFMVVMCYLSLRLVWNNLLPAEKNRKEFFWLPVLLFFTSPVTFYAYTNNVEEATMVVFALLSAGFQLKAIRSARNAYGWFALGGVALIASSMCKGAQGLFPVIVPLTWFFVMRGISLRKAFIGNCIVAIIPIAFYFGIALYKPAADSYLAYFHDRILATFQIQTTATTSSRFFLLYELLLDLLPALFVSALMILAARKITTQFRKEAIFLFVIGFSGIIPLMVTLEQRGFYLVTALPFVTTGIALLALDGAKRINQKCDEKRRLRIALASIAVFIFAATITATVILAGTPKRDAQLLHDVQVIGTEISSDQKISSDPQTWANWSLQGYLMRYHNISLSRTDTTTRYFIVPEGKTAPGGYSKVDLPTRSYHLYSR